MLEGFKGSGTELISVYIPSGFPIFEIGNKLKTELNQAGNIKSKQTRNNVTGSLERVINHLKIFKETPKNGLVIFCGNVSENEAKVDIQLFSFVAPESISTKGYHCDSKFYLDPLKELIEVKDIYGIVTMDGNEATLAFVKGTTIQLVRDMNSLVPAKISKGGQSSQRFQRLREKAIEEYHTRLGGAIDKAFLGKVKGLIIGGPGPAKEYFLKAKTFNYQLKVLGVVETGNTDESGIRETLVGAESFLEQQQLIKEKKLIDKFIEIVVCGGLATYGIIEVENAICTKQAEKILISEESKYFEKYLKLAEEFKIPIEVISIDTPEGQQFLNGYGGLGAFLRYKIR